MGKKELNKKQENTVREPMATYCKVQPIAPLSEKDIDRAISGEELLMRLRPRIKNLFR